MVSLRTRARKRISAAAFVLLLLVVTRSVAGAAQVSYSAPIASKSTDWIVAVALPQFDPTLGTLNSAVVTFTGDWQTMFRMENMSTQVGSGVYNASIYGTLILLGPSSETLISKQGDRRYLVGNANSVINGELIPVGLYDGTLDFQGPSALSASLGFGESGSYAPSDLSSFIGTGTVGYTAKTQTRTSHTLDGGYPAAGWSTSASGSVSVLYSYAAVPEPASILALAVGIVGLIARRRR